MSANRTTRAPGDSRGGWRHRRPRSGPGTGQVMRTSGPTWLLSPPRQVGTRVADLARRPLAERGALPEVGSPTPVDIKRTYGEPLGATERERPQSQALDLHTWESPTHHHRASRVRCRPDGTDVGRGLLQVDDAGGGRRKASSGGCGRLVSGERDRRPKSAALSASTRRSPTGVEPGPPDAWAALSPTPAGGRAEPSVVALLDPGAPSADPAIRMEGPDCLLLSACRARHDRAESDRPQRRRTSAGRSTRLRRMGSSTRRYITATPGSAGREVPRTPTRVIRVGRTEREERPMPQVERRRGRPPPSAAGPS